MSSSRLTMMVARIRRVYTGEVRDFANRDGMPIKLIGRASEGAALAAQRSLYTNGNYGCDCNLGLFYRRAGGDSEFTDYPEQPGGDRATCGNGLFELVRLVAVIDDDAGTVREVELGID